jgi:hypothetical protein
MIQWKTSKVTTSTRNGDKQIAPAVWIAVGCNVRARKPTNATQKGDQDDAIATRKSFDVPPPPNGELVLALFPPPPNMVEPVFPKMLPVFELEPKTGDAGVELETLLRKAALVVPKRSREVQMS